MNHVQVELLRAKTLIATPERWTKGHMALSANNNPIRPSCDAACKWCALGALDAIGAGDLAYRAAERAFGVDYSHEIPHVNDAPNTTHADVMRLFDRAIEFAGRH